MGFYVSPNVVEQNHIYYCITETLYESPNSTIYKGFGFRSNEEVVLKCFEKDAHGAYLREMADFGISHPHLVSYMDTFYLSDNRPCIVYRWFPKTLEQWLVDNGTVDQAFCFKCLDGILQALVHLNSLGRIHCDIKPHNVFMYFDVADEPHFILGDLGATCSLREAQETRYTVSTPAYMAPERLYQRFYFNSDLYSLGIMAFELSVGYRPFNGTPEEISRGHLSKRPDIEAIPYPLLRDFIGQLLEKDPAARIQNAEIALYLLRGLRGQSTVIPAQNRNNQTVFRQNSRIVPTGFLVKFNFISEFPPNNVMIFENLGNPIVALEYDNYLELRNMVTSKQRVLIKSGHAQAVDDKNIVFSVTNKLIKFDTADESEECLFRLSEATNYFFTDYGYLFLSNKYRSTYCELQNFGNIQFSQSNYFSDMYVGIFTDGSFCTNGGSCNQFIYWRDKKAQILGQWELHGPIVGLTCAENHQALVLTLDMQNSSRYAIWVITLDLMPKKLELTDKIRLYAHTKGYFFWLTDDNHLIMCGIDLIIVDMGRLSESQDTKSFSVSSDHRWLVTLSNGTDNQSIIDCYQAYGG